MWWLTEVHSFYSDVASKHGGQLLIEDAEGSITSTFLEEGFLEYLNKVFISFDVCILHSLVSTSGSSNKVIRIWIEFF